MDRHGGFILLQQYRNMPRPDGPLHLGDSGVLNGIEQTVIGIVGVATEVEGETYDWTDYQLYSPTHGYSWLTWNNNHVVHSRKIRGNFPELQNRYRMERIDALDRTFRFVERYSSEITFLEGELTWRARLGERTDTAEIAAAPYGISESHSVDEIEHTLQTYVHRDELVSAFDLKRTLPEAIGIHPIQPFVARFHSFLAKEAIAFAGLCLAIGVVLSIWVNGRVVAEGYTNPRTGNLVMEFESKRSNALTQLNATRAVGEIDNFEFFNVAIAHTKTRALQRGLLQPHREDYERPVGMRLDDAGKYTVQVNGVPLYKDDPIPAPVKVTVLQGQAYTNSVVWLSMLFALITLSYFVRRFLFSVRRWQE